MAFVSIKTREDAMKFLFPMHIFLALLIFIFPFLDLDPKSSFKGGLMFKDDSTGKYGLGLHNFYSEGYNNNKIERNYKCDDVVTLGTQHECQAARFTLYIAFLAVLFLVMASIYFYVYKETESKAYYPTFIFLYFMAIVNGSSTIYWIDHKDEFTDDGVTRGAQYWGAGVILGVGILCLIVNVFVMYVDPKPVFEGMGMNYEALLTDHR